MHIFDVMRHLQYIDKNKKKYFIYGGYSMKNIRIFSIMILNYLLLGCASISTANSYNWFDFELPPSKINYSGNVIMDVKLSDGSRCYVFSDYEIGPDDSEYYYSIFMQDFGWHKTGDGWGGYDDVRRAKRGHMYINPRRQVAIYFYPLQDYDVFKVRVERSTNIQ